jgi:hypothetical protein
MPPSDTFTKEQLETSRESVLASVKRPGAAGTDAYKALIAYVSTPLNRIRAQSVPRCRALYACLNTVILLARVQLLLALAFVVMAALVDVRLLIALAPVALLWYVLNLAQFRLNLEIASRYLAHDEANKRGE